MCSAVYNVVYESPSGQAEMRMGGGGRVAYLDVVEWAARITVVGVCGRFTVWRCGCRGVAVPGRRRVGRYCSVVGMAGLRRWS